MKTIKEWFESIEDPEIRNKALRNINPDKANIGVARLSMAIDHGLNWDLLDKKEKGYWGPILVCYIKKEKGHTYPYPTPDPINPDHYKNAIETIDAIEASMTPEAFRGYLKGNVIKYVTRYEKKNGLEDLKKADWYLSKLINTFASE
jgi:hypothetical protein